MPTRRATRLYVGLVTGLGIGLLLSVLAYGLDAPAIDALRRPGSLWLFAALVVLGETFPIRIWRKDGGEVTTSTTFSFAILLAHGAVAAMIVQGVASLLIDSGRRKPLPRSAFNAAQFFIAFALAGLVLRVLDTSAPDEPIASLPAILAAAAVLHFSNGVLTAGAIALEANLSPVGVLRRDFAFNASTAGVMLALSPIIVLISEENLPLVAFLLVTVLALYWSARATVETQHEALHDLLTDLPNRRLYLDRLEQALRESKRTGEPVAALLVDLDRFKEINDVLGHHVGDEVLRQFGPRLRGALREVDTVARLGGDEFAIILPMCGDGDAVREVGERVIAALRRPFEVQGFPLEVDASIGAAIYPDHGASVEILMQSADVAMYAAKQQRGGVEIYDGERDKGATGRIELLSQLRTALEQEQLSVHYQPKADLDSGRIVGVEALVRWFHPERGFIPPGEFVGLAENTELIEPLTRYVLARALRQCRSWLDEGLDLSVAVNLSVHNLYDRHFPATVRELLAEAGVAPGRLELELTENTVMADPLRAVGVLAELDKLGVRLAIDDFGTGYSSLVYLKQLPVDAIKVDRSFVMGMLTDDDDAVIVRSIIELGRNLGLEVVAEGIEDAATYDRLGVLGCSIGQGYFLSRPQAADQLTPWLLEREGATLAPVLALPFGRVS